MDRISKVKRGSSPFLFVAFLVLLVWIPLPDASNRPWSWALMEISVFLMAAIWLIGYARGRVGTTEAFRQAKPVLILFGLWLVYGLFQMIPLPQNIIEFLSPHTAAVYDYVQWDDAATPSMSASDFHPLSLDLHASIVSWVKSLTYVLLFTLAMLLVDSRQRLKTLAYVLVLCGIGQAIYGSLSVLSVGGGPVHGTFVNRNHFAGYMVLCLSLGIGLMLASMGSSPNSMSWSRKIRHIAEVLMSSKAPLRIFLIIMVIALVLTRSRMGNASFFTGMLVAGVLALTLFKNSPRPTVILIASLIVIDVVIIGSWVGIERVVERLEETTLETEKRDELNIYTWEMVKDYPILGSGGGSYYGVFPNYRGPEAGDKIVNHAHNDYFEFLSEYGVLGFAILGLVVAISLWKAVTAMRIRRDPLLRGLGFGVVMGMVAMLTHASVEFNLQIPAYAGAFIVFLSMSWLVRYIDREHRYSRRTKTELTEEMELRPQN